MLSSIKLRVFIYDCNLFDSFGGFDFSGIVHVHVSDSERKAVCEEGSHFHVKVNKIRLIRKCSFDYKTINIRDAWTSLEADASKKLCSPSWASPLHWGMMPGV